MIFIGIVAWAVLSGRAVLDGRVRWIVVAGVAILGLYVVMRLALPEAAQGLAVGLVGIALSGLLVWLALQYRDRLPPEQMRVLIGLAILGALFTVLGLLRR